MDQRYEALFVANRDIFAGARVLDLASHDGRWSFAALQAGAAHVTGVEVRQNFVDSAREIFAYYEQDPETYRFICRDVFDVLASEKFEVDLVLCLGYLYHTYRHTELLYRIHELAPSYMILDTLVTSGKRATASLFLEKNPEHLLSAARDPFSLDRVLVAHPSVPALRLMVGAYGYEVEGSYDWSARLSALPRTAGLEDYARDGRVTWRCRRSDLPVASEVPEGYAATGIAADPAPRDPQNQGSAAPPAPKGRRWRKLVNQGLAKTTGYELHKVPPAR